MDKEKDKEKLLKLPDGDFDFIAWSFESGGKVWKIENVFVLFEVPQCGDPIFSKVYRDNQIDELIEEAYSWT